MHVSWVSSDTEATVLFRSAVSSGVIYTSGDVVNKYLGLKVLLSMRVRPLLPGPHTSRSLSGNCVCLVLRDPRKYVHTLTRTNTRTHVNMLWNIFFVM